MHSADVKTVLRTFSIEVAAKDEDDLEEGPIIARLRKVCHCTLLPIYPQRTESDLVRPEELVTMASRHPSIIYSLIDYSWISVTDIYYPLTIYFTMGNY